MCIGPEIFTKFYIIFWSCLRLSHCASQLLEVEDHTCEVYFNHLLGAARTQKLVKILFSAVFNLFVHFKPFSVISRLKSTKNVWKLKKMCFCPLLKLKTAEKVLWPYFGCSQYPKAGQNTQHTCCLFRPVNGCASD